MRFPYRWGRFSHFPSWAAARIMGLVGRREGEEVLRELDVHQIIL